MVDLIHSAINKIDNQATLGLLGGNNSLAYRVHEIERHFHSREEWIGKSADQSGTDWSIDISAAGMPTVFQSISGNGVFGADEDDEAKVIGTGDTSNLAAEVKFDFHKLFIQAMSSTTFYVVRVVYGEGTMADAVTAKQYSEIMIKKDAAVGGTNAKPLDINMPRLTWGIHKVWIQCKNATNDATIDLFVGLHSYEG